MSFKSNIADFVNKHGYTYRSYCIASVIFPPAAIFIAFKRPNVPLIIRIILSAIAFVTPPFILGLAGFVVKETVQFLS